MLLHPVNNKPKSKTIARSFKTVRLDRIEGTNWGCPAVMQLGRLRGPNRLFGKV